MKTRISQFTRDTYNKKKRGLDVHACELSKGSDSYLPKLLPNARLTARLKRRFQKIIILSVKHPFTRWHFRSRAAVAFEKKRHGRSSHWWVIHPYSLFRFGWDVIMSFTYIYSFLAFPYMISYYVLSGTSNLNIFNVLIPSYVICLADVLVNFNTAYTSTASHEIFLDPILIARHYAQEYFLVDLISSLPYSWLFGKYILPPGENTNFPAILVELLPLVKLFRLPTLRKYVKQCSAACGIYNVYEIFLWLALLSVLICHWSACLIYGYPFFAMHVGKTGLQKSNAWFVKSDTLRKSAGDIYLSSLHIGVSELWSASFVEIQPHESADDTIRCLLMVFGKGYTIYIIGMFLKIFQNFITIIIESINFEYLFSLVVILELIMCHVAPELQYHQIMSEVNQYAQDKSLPKNLKDKLIIYYEYRYQGSYFKEHTITATLPSHLKHEIIVHTSHGILDNATIFYGLPRTLTTSIMATLKPDIYLKDDIIFKCDAEGDYMYFIASGTVVLITRSGKEVCHLEDGAYFGETVLVYPERRREVTVIALEICELLRFDRKDFNKIVPSNSDFFARLEKIAKARLDLLNEK
ncbi:LOW QUALITY PROTEIN: potassium/sodium hyperpolarization-activated cyclic nucleotide-gated channel 1 [Cephus cinctus]|uniref:LOW QUALITY PROTEIN: potassium/sodium hyperpolarization-activated cyclic nucleotide-gated channel 1 n=1 Tax=Cephus cinctus TaxID=211228 RepID=A0AAJ7RKB4_CEPCN|nr:LOW QUALITY PROTEIN: potassium/sodium hyperpolarization-activated cyclic nucleotide-gated channel 1 [Cephus cinctus]